jgi:hypothetical protein
MADVLLSFYNIVVGQFNYDGSTYSTNRINQMGDSFEAFVKNSFLKQPDESRAGTTLASVFSYLGSSTRPPDAMIRNGDVLEIKKVESSTGQLQFNSSFPKQKLQHDDVMISNDCKVSEDWTERDVVYYVGVIPKQSEFPTDILIVSGDCFAASRRHYEDTFREVQTALHNGFGPRLSVSKELGRINKVDPQANTSLRIRGMWLVNNPIQWLAKARLSSSFQVTLVLSQVKYNKYNEDSRATLESLVDTLVTMEFVKLPNPDGREMPDIDCVRFQFER